MVWNVIKNENTWTLPSFLHTFRPQILVKFRISSTFNFNILFRNEKKIVNCMIYTYKVTTCANNNKKISRSLKWNIFVIDKMFSKYLHSIFACSLKQTSKFQPSLSPNTLKISLSSCLIWLEDQMGNFFKIFDRYLCKNKIFEFFRPHPHVFTIIMLHFLTLFLTFCNLY